MKKYLIAVLSLVIFSCNQQGNSAVDEHAVHEHAATDTTNTGKDDHATLTLNNGAKWTSDESTDKNVAAMKTTADDFKQKSDPQVADYKTAGEQLGAGVQKMVTECKMQGADHDALHVWLEPLMKEVNQLKKVEDANEGKSLFASIDNRLNEYPKYFALP